MKYYITLARNTRSPCSLEVFNETCTAVIKKKKNWHAKFLYATQLIAPTWLKWFNRFWNLFLSERSEKRDFGGF